MPEVAVRGALLDQELGDARKCNISIAPSRSASPISSAPPMPPAPARRLFLAESGRKNTPAPHFG